MILLKIGLSAPFAGKLTFRHVQKYVDSVVLVSDDEIRAAVKLLYRLGLAVDPSVCLYEMIIDIFLSISLY